MNKKRNVSYIKPEDPEFLKVLKRQAGYDDKNHKFDELMNADEDFAEDDDSEQPQVVVLRQGDLTAEEAVIEQKRLENLELETKADLSQRVMYKPKEKAVSQSASTKRKQAAISTKRDKKSRQLLSFNDDEEDDDETNET